MLSLKSKNIIYITRDLERALGLPLNTKGYFIISNFSAFAKQLVGDKKNVLLVKSERVLDTRELLENDRVIKFIKTIKNPQILVFKNTIQIEKICADHGWKLLNPSARLASMVEEKIAGTKWLGELVKFLPPHKIVLGKELKWNGENFIIQFNRAHTGSGTILIKSEKDLEEIKIKFPEREVRVTKYVVGSSWTNNSVVWGKKVLCGNISYQITGMEPFTKLPFATVGNDWALPIKVLSAKQKKEYLTMATVIGKKMASEGWKGEFGIDVILEKETGKLYLIEINARQPASTSCESWLQSEVKKNKKEITTFEAHLLALCEEKYQEQGLVKIKNGAQITQKVMPESLSADKKMVRENIKKLSKQGWKIYWHDNNELEKDWIRLQYKNGLLESDGVLNENGLTAMFFATANLYRDKWDATRRVGAIITNHNKILLFKRHRFGNVYYCLPGGHQEHNEDLKTTAEREVEEETGLKVIFFEKKPIEILSAGQKEFYFFIESFKGDPVLGGEEKGRNQPGNAYDLEWINFNEIKKINLLPVELKNKLLKVLK